LRQPDGNDIIYRLSSGDSMTKIVDSLADIYNNRFPSSTRSRRHEVWEILCRDWFSRYIPPESRVLEVAAGFCEFINNISAPEKIAVDLNPELPEFAAPGVKTFIHPAEALAEIIEPGSVDVVFLSNFL